MVRINGKDKSDIEGLTIAQMLEKEGYGKLFVAVECNEEILDADTFTGHIINDGDVIEVVRFVGGG